ncbi:hypothetical protein EDD16DRAFT_1492485 [Pisolithus croceorrhizus]|nr:hypothetical protein EDD16DRAFT_1492485 [Pisolithus croceorrhizus]
MPTSAGELPYSVLYAASVSLTAVTFVAGISWGLMTALYVPCMYSLTCHRRRSTQTITRRTVLVVWITILWISSSLSTLANAYCNLYAYSWQLDYPGGPITYLADQWNRPMPALAYWTYYITMWFADALMGMVTVMFTIYIGAVGQFLITFFCVGKRLNSKFLASACYSLAILSTNQTFYSEYSQKAGIPCFTLSVTLNVFATALISIRLLSFKRWAEKNLGRQENSPYTSIIAMLIESSSLYATWSVVFIIFYAINNPGQYVMLMTLCNVQVIAPLLIAYRVSRGLAWEQNTSAIMMTSPHLFPHAGAGSDTVLELQDARYQPQGKSIHSMVFSAAARAEVESCSEGRG